MVFVLVIFCVFAMSVLLVLMLGGNIYKNMSEKIQEGYDKQTGLSYVWSKVKNGDASGSAYVGNFQGVSALCLEEQNEFGVYVTMVYFHDGWLRELPSEKGLEFSLEDGMPVIKTDSLSFEELPGGLIRAESDSGELYIYPRAQTGLALP